jgi:hypothetical protein
VGGVVGRTSLGPKRLRLLLGGLEFAGVVLVSSELRCLLVFMGEGLRLPTGAVLALSEMALGPVGVTCTRFSFSHSPNDCGPLAVATAARGMEPVDRFPLVLTRDSGEWRGRRDADADDENPCGAKRQPVVDNLKRVEIWSQLTR